MRTVITLRLATLTLCLAAACRGDGIMEVSYESGPNGIQAGYVSASARVDGILITNQTERPVNPFAIERGTAALADWIPCTTGPGCPAQTPGEQRVIAWSQVLGSAADRKEYVVYWWHSVAQPDGSLRAGPVSNVVITR